MIGVATKPGTGRNAKVDGRTAVSHVTHLTKLAASRGQQTAAGNISRETSGQLGQIARTLLRPRRHVHLEAIMDLRGNIFEKNTVEPRSLPAPPKKAFVPVTAAATTTVRTGRALIRTTRDAHLGVGHRLIQRLIVNASMK